MFDIETRGTPPGIVEREIVRRIEAHTGRKSGRWEVAVSVYGPEEKKRAPIEAVTFSDVKDRVFILLPSVVTEVEPAMLSLMTKISPYKLRVKRAVRGDEFDFEDFCFRVGVSFDRHNSPAGVAVEVEYRPCIALSECEGLILELMGRIVAPLVPPPHLGQDPSVSAAATTQYAYKTIKLDDKKVRPSDVHPYSHRTSALIFAKLLTSPTN